MQLMLSHLMNAKMFRNSQVAAWSSSNYETIDPIRDASRQVARERLTMPHVRMPAKRVVSQWP